MGSLRRIKTKRMKRSLDQVHADLRSPAHLSRHKTSHAAEDLPGLGRHYCIPCAKWFEGEHNLVQHRRGKNHKRRVRVLRKEEVPYSQKEAEAAVGLGVRDYEEEREKLKGRPWVTTAEEEKMEVDETGEVDAA